MYRIVKVRKEMEERGVKIPLSTLDSWASLEAPVSTLRVDTTDSLAVSPVISAVEARQSLKPSGANSGAIQEPREARMLDALSGTRLKRQSKLCKNQMISEATKIIVNALWRKSLAFSHICSRTLLGEGIR